MLKKKHKEGTWGIKALYPGKEGEEPMVVKFVSDTMERGINLATQELIAEHYKKTCVLLSGQIIRLNCTNLKATNNDKSAES